MIRTGAAPSAHCAARTAYIRESDNTNDSMAYSEPPHAESPRARRVAMTALHGFGLGRTRPGASSASGV